MGHEEQRKNANNWSNHEWVRYFRNNENRLMEIPWTDGYRITAAERRAISCSIAIFELGERGQGSHFRKVAINNARRTGDYDYLQPLDLFISEERRHSANLRRFMDLNGIPAMNRQWSNVIFRRVRKLFALETIISVLLIGEIIAKVYYRALKAATWSPVLKQICRQILRDEAYHVHFQSSALGRQAGTRSRIWRAATGWMRRILFYLTLPIVWIDHRGVLRAGGFTWRRFRHVANHEYRKCECLIRDAAEYSHSWQWGESSAANRKVHASSGSMVASQPVLAVGIEAANFYVPPYAFPLDRLALARGVDPAKYLRGIGQELMAVAAPDEDAVTMGANAAQRLLDRTGERDQIGMVILATESAIDGSKAGSIYIHRLLGLPSACPAFELKQACCGSSFALHLALSQVACRPDKKVLIIAADIARYGLGSRGEPTQGAGAAAFLVSADPALVAFDAAVGNYTEDVMDFWRPTWTDEAIVDGKTSIDAYLRALEHSWNGYREAGGRDLKELARICYHLPFSRMAAKAQRHLNTIASSEASASTRCPRSEQDEDGKLEGTLNYNRLIGNTYTASLYISLQSLLESTDTDLSGSHLGFFSFGSGCTAAFFSGTIKDGYRDCLDADFHRNMLADRTVLDYDGYEEFYRYALPRDGSHCLTPRDRVGDFRLSGMSGNKRIYEPA